MSALRCLSVVNHHGTKFISPARKNNLQDVATRAYAITSWQDPRFFDDKEQLQNICGQLLQCKGCLSSQPVRYAWFTKSKYGPKMPPTKHLDFNHSGDSTHELPEVDPMTPRLGYEKCDELKSADEQIKRLFSLKFGTRDDRKEYEKHELLSLVQLNANDYVSQGAKIARLTLKIRKQIQYCLQFRKDKIAKTNLNNNIQTRNRLLKELEACDRTKYLQVCDALGVKHIPVPRLETHVPRFARPQAIHKAKVESEAIRKEKTEALEAKLEEEKKIFYAEKKVIMEQIENDLKAMGVDGQEMMKEIFEKERKEEQWLNSKWYKFLQRFPTVPKKYVTMKVQQ